MLVDSDAVAAWIRRLVTQLAEAPFIELTAVVVATQAMASARSGRRVGRFEGLLFRAYAQADRRLFGVALDAFHRVALDDADVRVIRLDGGEGPAVERLRDIADGVDVLLDLGTRLGRSVATLPRFGVWSYVVEGDDAGVAAGLVRKLIDGEHVYRHAVVMSRDGLATRVLAASCAAVDPLSLHRTRNEAYWEAPAMVLRVLRSLGSPKAWDEEVSPASPVHGTTDAVHMPTTLEVVRLGLNIGRRAVLRKARAAVFQEQWFVAYRRRQPDALPLERMDDFTLVLAPTDRFYADPFVASAPDGRRFVFFEDYRYADGKAVISCVELFVDGTVSTPRVVLDRPYHLSYPFVFFTEGEAYLVPETAQARRVEAYRAVDFPDSWEPSLVLVDGEALFDPTFVEHGGRLWLFATPATSQGKPADELVLFWADSLRGRWHEHRRNPVVADVRFARPAGRPVTYEGRLIRPAQDGSVRYGYGLCLREVVDLSPDSYREVEMRRITPDWLEGNVCTHHYDTDGSVEVVDGRLRTPRWQRRRGIVLQVAAGARRPSSA